MNFHLNQSKFIQIYIPYRQSHWTWSCRVFKTGDSNQWTVSIRVWKNKNKTKGCENSRDAGEISHITRFNVPSRGRTGHPVQGAISMGMLQ